MMDALTPIVRGRCDRCGMSRNIWMNEIVDDLPCDHRDRGCTGFLKICYTGPKAFFNESTSGCTCPPRAHRGMEATMAGVPPSNAAATSVAGEGIVPQLIEMGFPGNAAVQASSRFSSVEPAVEWLMSPEGQRAVETCGSSGGGTVADRSASGTPASSAAAAASTVPTSEVYECSICTEDMTNEDAAMRCNGVGGKKHYFHAHCLLSWVRQCQRDGNTPTCPECRGPVQIRPCRLSEFLEKKGSRLNHEEAEAMRSFRDGASGSADKNGWADVRRDLFVATAAVGVAVGLGLAIAAGVHAFSSKNRSRDQRDT
eukprot:TRINITY_DN28857_c0_g1_i1.p1 TRINITY_DN28857_c0_g1~~TRINITY_DN28857_c0_g1_i1.p1  ORF type:complete len:345 (+),score=53.79 TRINITY_DN28857_c0_g1_i1:99-1037(+)